MVNSTGDSGWLAAFPALGSLAPGDRARLTAAARPVVLAPGAAAFTIGAPCSAYLMVTAGSVRVHQVGDGGREIVLYRVSSGETCVLTTACLLGDQRYPAEGHAEGEVRARALPRPEFDALVAESAPFRTFVFGGFGRRIVQLMEVIDAVSFGRVDPRLAALLLARARDGSVTLTHEAIAIELGSAREVVSRRLKAFQQAGLVSVARGHIGILQPAELRAMADGGR